MSQEQIRINNLKIRELIAHYQTLCEKDETDKEQFLYFLDTFDDILTRKNVIGHITSSGFVINEDFNRTLVVKHNIMDGYIFPGGHADGNENLLEVAEKEVLEETGIQVVPYQIDPFYINVGAVPRHFKRGFYVAPHLHFDVIYLFIAKNEDMKKVRKLENENSDVKWIDLKDAYNGDIVPAVREANEGIVSKIRVLKKN